MAFCGTVWPRSASRVPLNNFQGENPTVGFSSDHHHHRHATRAILRHGGKSRWIEEIRDTMAFT